VAAVPESEKEVEAAVKTIEAGRMQTVAAHQPIPVVVVKFVQAPGFWVVSAPMPDRDPMPTVIGSVSALFLST